MKILKKINPNFYKDLEIILKKRFQHNVLDIDNDVRNIILDVIKRGDLALFEYAKKYDESIINELNILLPKDIKESYKKNVDNENISSFKVAIKNITKFHEMQKPKNYEIINKGVKTASIWKPINSVGLYIPGGNAVYPSSLIMNVIPAKVAGVKRIVVVTPSKLNKINPYILCLLDELSISEVYQIGGVHSIAALAYGTKSIEPVNKIFGPGNAYIACAKKQVFGKVGIDLIAGPSEIVVVADKNNNSKWVAADLIAQAEHDSNAQSILITDNDDFANNVILDLKKLIKKLPRKKIIENSLDNYGIVIIIDNFEIAHEIINFIAPEHLHLHNATRYDIIKYINNAGAIFVGEYSSEVFGDYIVGTNHILPTSGAAKFSSGVGVLDFMKRISVVEMDLLGYQINKDDVVKMADVEKFEGHKLSVKIRQIGKK